MDMLARSDVISVPCAAFGEQWRGFIRVSFGNSSLETNTKEARASAILYFDERLRAERFADEGVI